MAFRGCDISQDNALLVMIRRICRPYAGWLLHSAEFGELCDRHGVLQSMGATGVCWDNAAAESFFGTLQLELLDRQTWKTRRQLAQAIFEYIEAFYNPERRHTSINNMSPIDYENSHNRPAAVA